MAFWELERDGRVRLHVRIDERSAAFTALGLAKASRRPVAVLCTSGTAAANFHPAVIEADESAVPLLVLTADRPPELRGTGASQTIDQVKLYGSAVRWYAEAGVPERRPGMAGYWRSLACRAWAHAAGGAGHPARPGPPQPPVPRPPRPGRSACRRAMPPRTTQHLKPPLTAGRLPRRGTGQGSRRTCGRTPAGRNRWPADGGPWTRVSAAAAVAEPLELPWTERGVVVCGDGDYDAAALVDLAERAGLAGPRRAVVGGAARAERPDRLPVPARLARVHGGAPAGRHRLRRTAGSDPAAVRAARPLARAGGACRPACRVGTGPGCGPTRSAPRPTSPRGPPGRRSRHGAPPAGSTRGGTRTPRRPAAAAAAASTPRTPRPGCSEPEVARELVAALPENALLWCGNSLSVRDIDLAAAAAGGHPRDRQQGGERDRRHVLDRRRRGPRARGRAPGGGGVRPDRGPVAAARRARAWRSGPAEPRPDLCVVVVNNDGGGSSRAWSRPGSRAPRRPPQLGRHAPALGVRAGVRDRRTGRRSSTWRPPSACRTRWPSGRATSPRRSPPPCRAPGRGSSRRGPAGPPTRTCAPGCGPPRSPRRWRRCGRDRAPGADVPPERPASRRRGPAPCRRRRGRRTWRC